MANKRDIAINTVSQIIVRVGALFVALASVKLLTNYLGTVGTGNFNTITTYLNFFIVIADLGLFSVAVREISKKPEEEKKILGNVFLIRLVTAVIATGISIAIVLLTDYSKEIKVGSLIAAGFLFFNLISSVYDVVLQTRLKMQFSALAEFSSKVISLLALYLIVLNHGSFYWIVSTITLSGVTIFLLKWIFARKFISFSAKYDQKIANWIFTISLPIGIVFILNNLFFKIDTLLLFAIKGASAVGIYTVAYKVLEVTIFAGSYFASALKPSLSKYINEDKTRVANMISKSFLVMMFMSMPIALVSIIYSHEIVLFLSNPDFISGASALVILSCTLPFLYVDVLLGEILIAKDERKLLTKIAAFALSFNLIMNLIFIPRYSFMGAASVTLASEIILMFINIHYTRKIIPWSVKINDFAKIIIISVITLIIGIILRDFLKINFIIQIVLLFVLFFALLYGFKFFTLKNVKEVIEDK